MSATNPVLIPEVPLVPAVAPTVYQPPTYRARTTYTAPTPLSIAAGVTNTARDAYKVSYDRHVEFSNSHSLLTAALLLSIGQELTGRISDPVTGTFDLTPAIIVNEMFNLYGSISLTNEDIVLLRHPLKTRLTSLATFDSHVTSFRHAFSKLERVGQGVPKLEAFNLFSASISHHPILHNPIQFYHAQHPTITSHDWLLLSSHISPQIPFLVSSAPTSPFAGLAALSRQRFLRKDDVHHSPPHSLTS